MEDVTAGFVVVGNCCGLRGLGGFKISMDFEMLEQSFSDIIELSESTTIEDVVDDAGDDGARWAPKWCCLDLITDLVLGESMNLQVKRFLSTFSKTSLP